MVTDLKVAKEAPPLMSASIKIFFFSKFAQFKLFNAPN